MAPSSLSREYYTLMMWAGLCLVSAGGIGIVLGLTISRVKRAHQNLVMSGAFSMVVGSFFLAKWAVMPSPMLPKKLGQSEFLTSVIAND